MTAPPDRSLAAALAAAIRDVSDFPKPGIAFKDITPVLHDPALFRRTTEALAAYQQEYPGKLQFVYGPQRYTKPFLVRSIWNDGQFTYIKSDATELPALYELKDGKPGLLNFQVQNGTYIVPKVLDRGYLSLGKERFEFLQQGR